jgi:cytochrome c oxidase accessory protein FixG
MSVSDLPKSAPSEAAAGVEQIDVRAVNRKTERLQYASRQKIYPKLTSGFFRNVKWLVMLVCMGIYYVAPWIRWDRGAGLPDQAILIDMANGRLFFFGLEIWPQELYLVTGLLVVAALGLFLVSSVAGRVWCGYFCWQTVWTDLMVAVERLWQGDRNARIRLDKEPWGVSKIFKKTMTHISWLLISAATGGAFILYFDNAPTMFFDFFRGQAAPVTYLFFALLTGFTYLFGGLAREQVCIYMCPWPRIQGAMFDADSLLVTYRDFRGEPRGALRKQQGWEGRGDCIDCKACVAVCPMGIDIRDGAQLECITCALCIDACDEIMDKVGKPRGLIAYDTFRSIESEKKGGAIKLNLLRPRTLLYLVLITAVSALMLAAIGMRSVLDLNAVADRNPLYVTLSDGGIRNTFTLKILNKLYGTRTYTLEIEGLEGAKLTILGMEKEPKPKIDVVPDDLREIRAWVSIPPAALAKLPPGETIGFNFVARDAADGKITKRSATFRKPN